MAVVIDDVDRAGVYARSSQGRRVQPAATNRHSHISTRRWCVGGLAVKQEAYDRSRVFSRASRKRATSLLGAVTADSPGWTRKSVFKSGFLNITGLSTLGGPRSDGRSLLSSVSS